MNNLHKRVRTSILLQRSLPMHGLTACAGRLARCRHSWVAQCLIRAFVRWHHVDLHEALLPDPRDYASFNEFFARALHPSARPLASVDWVSPADGTVTQYGRIQRGQLLQAKGRCYSVRDLLADDALGRHFEGGTFATVYLSPRDYHRVHMPCDGWLVGMRYVPGALLSVRPDVVESVDGLLARNERVICWFEHPNHGMFALVLVGAAIVGSVATAWHGVVARQDRRVRQWNYGGSQSVARSYRFRKGEEMGRFLMGSTVVVLMPAGPWKFDQRWDIGKSVRFGQRMAALVPLG
ncbi:archaetidylserine decarboxylase [Rhodanobacter denitrificans]|uniref:archaetidylserine decarboxylase n=1 Tax=Rhodanobacter denitrificans TaxID=666685 RepID=UPI001EEA06CE|nr:archaetidylserine decarboxylase [Rhodanobacter denitrificans]UJJ60230.1 archaetidylserine decarboxylase [Rhodanobacter denitrificans]